MSQIKFVEAFSTDPFVREIHQKVMHALNDATLDRYQRESQIRKLQDLLIQHQFMEGRRAAQHAEKQAQQEKAAQIIRNTGIADPAQILARRKEFEPSSGDRNKRSAQKFLVAPKVIAIYR